MLEMAALCGRAISGLKLCNFKALFALAQADRQMRVLSTSVIAKPASQSAAVLFRHFGTSISIPRLHLVHEVLDIPKAQGEPQI